MTLIELIEILKNQPLDKVVPVGIGNPGSYRGYYSEIAFELIENVSVYEMLTSVESCIGRTFEGYKGGKYTMEKYTCAYLASDGQTGEELNKLSLYFLLNVNTESLADLSQKIDLSFAIN